MNMPQPGPGPSPAPSAPPAGAPPAPGASAEGQDKEVMLTAKADGTFTIQPMEGGQPQGDPIPAQSFDDAIQSVQDSLGLGSEEKGENPMEEAGESSAQETAEEGQEPPDGGLGGDTNPDLEEAKAMYAKKKGTRPAQKPGWSDYLTGSNPMAK